jgi:adenylate kinase family enzyme
MDLLRRRLELTLSEQRVLWTLIAYDLDPRLRRLLDHLATNERGGVTLGTLLALLYHDAPGPGYVELAPEGHLDALRLIEIDAGALSASQRSVRAVDRVIELASGIVRLDREVGRYARLDPNPVVRSLVMENALDETVTSLVANATNNVVSPIVVLAGASGAGRRTLARNAIARAGLSLLSVDCDALPTSATDLDCALRSALREARLFGAAVVFENLDHLLQDQGAPKARILDHAGLSALRLPTIAIMSTECSVPTSRAVHSIAVPPLRETDRLRLWRDSIGRDDAAELSAEFASRYHVTGGVIVAAAHRATQQADAEKRQLSPEDVHHAIRGHVDSLLGGLGTRVFTTQTWDDVILPSETLAEINEMVTRVKHRRQVFENWGFAKKLQRGLGLSALFHGPPGTGKTMVAGLIARELGLDLYQVDLSRIVSKWVEKPRSSWRACLPRQRAGTRSFSSTRPTRCSRSAPT